jgi:hypothetical protein
MATDLRKIFFKAIVLADVQPVSRLLYSTPNIAAGLSRLSSWTVSKDELDPAFSSRCSVDELPDVLDALSLSIVLCSNDAFDRINLSLLIISVCNEAKSSLT